MVIGHVVVAVIWTSSVASWYSVLFSLRFLHISPTGCQNGLSHLQSRSYHPLDYFIVFVPFCTRWRENCFSWQNAPLNWSWHTPNFPLTGTSCSSLWSCVWSSGPTLLRLLLSSACWIPIAISEGLEIYFLKKYFLFAPLSLPSSTLKLLCESST
jgi:hypothetical protein